MKPTIKNRTIKIVVFLAGILLMPWSPLLSKANAQGVKILITKDTYKMGIGLMKKTSEKGIIRLVKVAAGVTQ